MKTTADSTSRRSDADGGVVRGVGPVVTPGGHEGQTRSAIVTLLLEEGPISASDVGTSLGISAAGVRRHLEALIDSEEARTTTAPGRGQRGRGRPAKLFQLTAAGRSRLGHSYDDLAGAAMRHLREIGGDAAVKTFAHRRIQSIVGDVTPADPRSAESVERTAEHISRAMSDAGFAASTRPVGNGVQICQHHCPVSHVAAEFPELCDAEREAFADLLGTHVQRLATIANGDSACTTHVPLGMPDALEPPVRSTEQFHLDQDRLDQDRLDAEPRRLAPRRNSNTSLRKELA